MTDYIIFVSMALFFVYMKRENRWAGFTGAMSGKYRLPPSK